MFRPFALLRVGRAARVLSEKLKQEQLSASMVVRRHLDLHVAADTSARARELAVEHAHTPAKILRACMKQSVGVRHA